MPSSLSHAMIAVAAGAALAPRAHLRSFLMAAAGCAIIPDVDAIGRVLPFGDGDIELLGGHRGFTHSLAFAGLAGLTVAAATAASRAWDGYRVRLVVLIAVATAAHGALDALTSIGAVTTPVQFFSPFSSRGFTSTWHLIHGPFGELFLCVLPFGSIAYIVWHVRGLPWPERLPSVHTTDSSVVRSMVYLLLVALLAFWGWRSEARLANERRDDPARTAGRGHP